MARYKRKNPLIEAFQWNGENNIEGLIVSPVSEPTEENPSGLYGFLKDSDAFCLIVNKGDYILIGENGRRLPMAKEVFESAYELSE